MIRACFALALLAGCQRAVDTGLVGDSGLDDSGLVGDTGAVDTDVPFQPLDGVGAITGDCGVLDDELTDASPSWFRNVIDFGGTEVTPDLLTEPGKAVYDAGNLGGNSLWSEVFAFELLYRCELAALLKTEGEIAYRDAGGKKTDLLVDIDDFKVGVSVTRAYHYPPTDPYTEAMAAELLTKKLGDIPLSTANVAPGDAWVKQILSVLAYTPEHADALRVAWDALDPGLRGDTVVVVTVTEGEDEFLY